MRGNILILTVSRVIWSMSNSIVYPYQSLYVLELGGSKPIIGLVNAIGGLAGFLLYPVGGYIADKSGRAKLVGLSTFLYASSFLIFIFAPSWQWLAFGIAYQQIVLFYMPALNAIMADSIPVGTRGKILSITIAIPEAVRILIPYIGGWLIAVYTLGPAMRLGYALSFVMAFLVAFIRFRYLKETIENGNSIGWDIPKILKESYSEIFASTHWVFSHLRGYAVMAVLLALINAVVQPFWIVQANEVKGLSAYDWGIILLISGLVRTAVSMVVGSLVDRLGPRRCILIALVMAIPTVAAFAFARSFNQALLVYIVLVVSDAFLWIASNVLLADTIPRNVRGRVMATLGQGIGVGISGGGYAHGFLLFIPSIIGSFLGGYIYQSNPFLPWLLQAAIMTLSILLVFILVREPEKAEA